MFIPRQLPGAELVGAAVPAPSRGTIKAVLGLGKGKKRKMKGGREGLRNHLDLGISSAFSISRRKTNFFFNLEVAECMNGVLEALGENAFLFVLKMHFYMRICNAWNRYSRVISLC